MTYWTLTQYNSIYSTPKAAVEEGEIYDPKNNDIDLDLEGDSEEQR